MADQKRAPHGRAAALKTIMAFASIGLLTNCMSQPPRQVAAPLPTLPTPIPKSVDVPLPPAKLALADLARYEPGDIIVVLGTPSLRREEGTMQVLQFTSGRCITDLVFNGNAQLVHVEARAKTGVPIEIQPCLDSFDQNLRALKKPDALTS